MEEGIHSMRVGGKRRVIMPQQLGYAVQGLGPYPADPRKRDVLVKVRCLMHSKAAFKTLYNTSAHTQLHLYQ